MISLATVTATSDPARSFRCRESWKANAQVLPAEYLVVNGASPVYRVTTNEGQWHTSGNAHTYVSTAFLGVVPAFAIGVQRALDDGHGIIACLHDDLELSASGWDDAVRKLFKTCPKAGLCGFGGARGLGHSQIYQIPYAPHQLARELFMSNMRDAEAHGQRVTGSQPVACLDGFSQIGLRAFWQGVPRIDLQGDDMRGWTAGTNLFAQMQSWGIVHHAYDAALGCFARRLGYQVWLLPLACHHHGGLTAVADPNYHQWAGQQRTAGDATFWEEAHAIVYQQFKDVLPIRL